MLGGGHQDCTALNSTAHVQATVCFNKGDVVMKWAELTWAILA